MLVVGFAGCYVACAPLLKDSYKVREWGWKDGKGPGEDPEMAVSTHFGTPAEARDTAAPDPAKDAAAKQGLERIHSGLVEFANDKGRPYDEQRDGAWEVALQPYVDPWPENPWTGEPMREGVHRGDVQFATWSDGLDLTVYISP